MGTMNADALRVELVRNILETDDVRVLEQVKRALTRILSEARNTNKVAEDEVKYISKEEILNGIREGLTEFYTAKKEGRKQKTLEEWLDEL